jgi:hypothetical protein
MSVPSPVSPWIVANMSAREPGSGEQRFRAVVSTCLNTELSTRAARQGIPIVPARPWSDGLDRVDAALRR